MEADKLVKAKAILTVDLGLLSQTKKQTPTVAIAEIIAIALWIQR